MKSCRGSRAGCRTTRYTASTTPSAARSTSGRRSTARSYRDRARSWSTCRRRSLAASTAGSDAPATRSSISTTARTCSTAAPRTSGSGTPTRRSRSWQPMASRRSPSLSRTPGTTDSTSTALGPAGWPSGAGESSATAGSTWIGWSSRSSRWSIAPSPRGATARGPACWARRSAG